MNDINNNVIFSDDEDGWETWNKIYSKNINKLEHLVKIRRMFKFLMIFLSLIISCLICYKHKSNITIVILIASHILFLISLFFYITYNEKLEKFSTKMILFYQNNHQKIHNNWGLYSDKNLLLRYNPIKNKAYINSSNSVILNKLTHNKFINNQEYFKHNEEKMIKELFNDELIDANDNNSIFLNDYVTYKPIYKF